MRSRSPCSRARAWSASWAYCCGLSPLRLCDVNMRRSLPRRSDRLDGGQGMAESAQAAGRPGERGGATRLEAFVDAAFAFAVTLLVISVDAIPDSTAALVAALKSIPAFAACFAMIAMFWASHARWSRRHNRDGVADVVLSLTLVFTVLVYVYPLRLQFGVFFAWASGGWLPYPMAFDGTADVSFMFLVYGLAFASMSLCMAALYGQTWRNRGRLGLDAATRAEVVGELAIFGWFTAVATASVVAALTTPADDTSLRVGLPGMLYALLGLTGPVNLLAVRRAGAAAAVRRAPVAAAGVLVTGTDTGVGKSLCSVALLHALRAQGLRAVGMKPVAAGCEPTADGLRNEDAVALLQASAPRPSYADVNPWALPEPTAPQLAARAAGVRVELAPVLAAHARLAANADVVVVEGAGGWLSPLGDGIEHADLARALQLPVLLVVGLRLGCLSHARLSVQSIEADGCRLIGWVGSAVDPAFERRDDYLDLLRAALPAPCLGVLPHAPAADPALLASNLAPAASAIAGTR
ncbi:dethiobiotin synthase [Luteimonas yindakuii]|uniref:ATP-dependent dethiobiotin synthetase BioD n=1 Tax=Luteimonas yindakuii TaxID=2565782 RepID=A0A4Z1R9R7_9GAMM|nr:dethiobiotin synthase [Luteimonas yindakuii]